jgi:hypothetical protein
MPKDTTELVVAGSGSIYVAPFGTTLPTQYNTTLNGSFEELGYTTEDGLTFQSSPTVENFTAWQSRQPVRRELTALEQQITCTLEQWNERNVITAFGGGDVIQMAASSFKYVPVDDDEQLDELSVVADWQDGTEQYRLVIPRCNVTESVEVQLTRDSLALLPVTFSVLKASGQDAWNLLTNGSQFNVAS